MSRSLYARWVRLYQPGRDGVSRRDFLRRATAAGAALVSGGMGPPPPPSAGPLSPNRIVVVGAGLAGLACAYELRCAGYDVTVLEARERVGGRVISFGDMAAGKTVEGGGEFIGSNHLTWGAYAVRFGLKLLEVTWDEGAGMPVVLDGRRLEPGQVKALLEEMEEAFRLMTTEARSIDAEEPWKSAHAAELDRRTTGGWVDQLAVSALCKRALRVHWESYNGVEIGRQGYLGNLAMVKGGGLEKFWTESEVYRCHGGNQRLAAELATALRRGHLLNRLPVTAIEVEDRGAVVTCATGRTLEADDVVLAVPPSVWSRIDIRPALPPALRPQMGEAVKYLAGVRERFWRGRGLSPLSLTDGLISRTWEGTDHQPGPGGAVLVASAGGRAARRICEARDAAPELYRRELERLYPGLGEQFVSGRAMDWPGDPWTRGGYSFPAPGEVTTVGPLLRAGLGRLHFAGEHACPKFVGFMEGALSSGVAVAKRLAVRDGAMREE